MHVIYILVAALSWSLWAFFPRLAQETLGRSFSAVGFQFIGSLGTVALALVSQGIAGGRSAMVWHPRGALFAALAGIAGGIGSLSYYRACGLAPVSVVATLTGLYPLGAVILSRIFLGEVLDVRQYVGFALVLVGGFLALPK